MFNFYNMIQNCFCGSNIGFAECCEPYLEGKSFAKTAEQLMRSRYSAHATGASEYLKLTSYTLIEDDYDDAEMKQLAKYNHWQKLEVLTHTRGQANDELGTVEYKAYYKYQNDILRVHHENANFVKAGGKWQYHSGTMNPKIKTQQRNEPCACDSGKKYKKCCG